jgi:tetratricopeptide (TPR) repeat protein
MNGKQRLAEGKPGRFPVQPASPATRQRFPDAVRHHQAGRFREAAHLCRAILARDPQHADGLHLLGLIAHQMGQQGSAVDLVRRAIAINAKAAAYHSNLGNLLKAQGQLAEAVTCYRKALTLEPDFADAHFNLGIALAEQGKLEEAIACFRRVLALRPDFPGANDTLGDALMARQRLDEAVACYRNSVNLRPDFPSGHFNLGNALARRGRPDEAIGCYRRALDLSPDFLEAQNNLGNVLRELGRLDEAAACYRAVLDVRPDSPEVANNLGIVLDEQGRLDEAVACYRRVLALRPHLPEAHNNLGHALDRQGRLDEAIACFRGALGVRPDFPRAHYNLGNTLAAQRRLDEAVTCYDKALSLTPDYPEAHNNRGKVLREQGRLDEAVAALRRAVDLKPDFADAHGNLAIALLARGDWTAGWQEYEWRWKTPPMIKARRDFAQPQWRGQAAEGQTLLVHAEQGLGDTVQFCRYASLAAARGLRVVVEVQKPLVRLLRGLPGVDAVVGRGETLPDFDLHCPMLSMPLALGTTLATIPRTSAYLHADEAQVAAWRTRLATGTGQGPRIGLVWAGSAKLASDARRSVAPGRLAPLFGVPRLQFFSLQKAGPPAPGSFPLTDFMNEMEDFADTAALVTALDLVISVDTAVAHLAAALGKPVWLLDRFDPDWRWFAGQRNSPWYPTLRRYRQPHHGDWDSVLAEVVHDLRSLAEV